MRERPDVDLNLIQRQLTAITSYLKATVWKPEKSSVTLTDVPDRTPSANHSQALKPPNESQT
jgi:hypothetical protein